MKINIKNFAKIKEAELNLNGITVICGDNDSGKSTVGKILFSIFDTNYNILSKIKNDLCSNIIDIIRFYRNFNDNYSLTEENKYGRLLIPPRRLISMMTDRLLNKINYPYIEEKDVLKEIKDFISFLEDRYDAKLKDDIYYEIYDKIKIPYTDLLRTFNQREFNNIFNYQINSLYNADSVAKVDLEVIEAKFNISFKNNKCTDFNLEFNVENNIFYIENPFIIDSINKNYDCNTMNETLLDALKERPSGQNNIFYVYENNEILEKIKNIFDEIHLGDIIEDNNNFYIKYNNDVNMKFETLSTGIKSFLIIKILLENTSLKKKDILILDEPEIHLHPAWQLKYAEMIVLLQKYLDLTIIINTHSYYFLEAINQYSRKHKTKDNVNFYLSKLNNDGKNSTLDNVTDNLEDIYSKMYEPIKKLENLEFEND